ncbi:hypothetical protein [Croceicoccus mobilis]|uniref:Uncharacterized protein n=1 Tax=Croceicoccus mobilis TaxID=1703339 RepID=A0A916Z519_9SPHN|nr:hypothetical protein [Croceicoccus mobilis]GGD74035.1 hypothetical protein GCM10010990_24580 [Croceicoccus mobilis]
MAGGKITERGTEISCEGVHFSVQTGEHRYIVLGLQTPHLAVAQSLSPRMSRELAAALIRQADATEKAAVAA